MSAMQNKDLIPWSYVYKSSGGLVGTDSLREAKRNSRETGLFTRMVDGYVYRFNGSRWSRPELTLRECQAKARRGNR